MNDIKRKRLEKRILQTIAILTQKDIKNPNIGFVTFTRCELSKDGSHAKVYVSIFESDRDDYNKSFAALQGARGFFRKKISDAIRMRIIPEINFIPDKSIEQIANLPDS